jgi:hypothetical protein
LVSVLVVEDFRFCVEQLCFLPPWFFQKYSLGQQCLTDVPPEGCTQEAKTHWSCFREIQLDTTMLDNSNREHISILNISAHNIELDENIFVLKKFNIHVSTFMKS